MFSLLNLSLLSMAAYGGYKAYKALASPLSGLNNPFKDDLKRKIFKFAVENKIPPALMLATIRQESNFDPFAKRLEPSFFQRRVKINPKYEYEVDSWGINETNFGSYGLGQILLTTAWDMGYNKNPQDLYDVKTNLKYMGKLQNALIKQFSGGSGILDESSIKSVMSAYNSGKPYDKAPMITVQDYVPRVLKFFNEFQAQIDAAQGVV